MVTTTFQEPPSQPAPPAADPAPEFQPAEVCQPEESQALMWPTPDCLSSSPNLERAPIVPASPMPGVERHRRKCAVCHHPDLETIDEEFIHWRNPWYIAKHYGIPERTLYRHAHATGLYARRRGNIRFVLDQILQCVGSCNVTADSVIRAVRAYACLTDDGKWVEPATNVVVSSGGRASADDPAKIGITVVPAIGEGREAEGRPVLPGANRNQERPS